MFGMSSEEFWEKDPQLYWSYRTFYLKQKEIEQKEKVEYLKYMCWLSGNTTYIAQSVALNNAFSKTKRQYPKYDEMFGETERGQKKKTKKEVDIQVQKEFNSWARM